MVRATAKGRSSTIPIRQTDRQTDRQTGRRTDRELTEQRDDGACDSVGQGQHHSQQAHGGDGQLVQDVQQVHVAQSVVVHLHQTTPTG